MVKLSKQDALQTLEQGEMLCMHDVAIACDDDMLWGLADQKRIDQQLEEFTRELKKLTALLADKGAGPDVGPGMLNAMLKLRDTEAEKDSDDEDE